MAGEEPYNHALTQWTVGHLLDYLTRSDIDVDMIIRLEFAYRDLLYLHRSPLVVPLRAPVIALGDPSARPR